MDKYTPQLLSSTGLKGMIGKGNRNEDVIRSMGENCCVYFAAAGGAGALLAEHIEAAEIVAYNDLGPEAIYKLEIRDFPLIVAIDCFGNNLYLEGPRNFRKS
jgi:fumarate hydratase subunit beta